MADDKQADAQETPEQVNAQAPLPGPVDSKQDTPSGQPAQTPAEQTPQSDEIRDPAAFYQSRYEAANRLLEKAQLRTDELEKRLNQLSEAQQDEIKGQIETVRSEAKAEARTWQVKALIAARGLPDKLAQYVKGEDEDSINKELDELAELFKAAPRAAQPATRIANGGSGPSLSIDEIKRMKPEEVAKRWDEVQAVMRNQQ